MSELKSVEPEPELVENVPGIPSSLPKSGNTHPYLIKSISFLTSLQKYSVLPFGAFSAIHIASVVISPAIFGPEVGNDMISVGRELYHVPMIEIGIFISAGIHVLSGITCNILKKYYNYVKYGKYKVEKNDSKEKIEKSMRIKGNPEDNEVTDINEGLGGIGSMIGIGSRKSITSRLFGLSPIGFSGYVFLFFLAGHVFHERMVPILVDGDSSLVDMMYVAYTLQDSFITIFSKLNLLVITGCYHMLVGGNRYLKQFSLKARKRTYITLGILSSLTCVSIIRINNMEVFNAVGNRFQLYLDY